MNEEGIQEFKQSLVHTIVTQFNNSFYAAAHNKTHLLIQISVPTGNKISCTLKYHTFRGIDTQW